ncbi:unnamed protein product [Mycena citricolor]|uniref:DUF6534 domain-containing protein n=1 Tax=Mycena citricolor TaxID=2018698 RepID=A0AAD2Q661_9AGAR|nr:unnamed protein product [Mycena citricolor]
MDRGTVTCALRASETPLPAQFSRLSSKERFIHRALACSLSLSSSLSFSFAFPPSVVDAMADTIEHSVIQFSPASKAFMANRITALGAWVIAGFVDAILFGIVACQVVTFFQSYRRHKGIERHYGRLVLVVTVLATMKTAQSLGIIWAQTVVQWMNPDVAQTLVAKAWFEVSTPTMTAITAIIVQSFFTMRFYMLLRNFLYCIPILMSMMLSFAAVCLSLNSIVTNNTKAKIMWLLVHLVCTFCTDFMITVGTCLALQKRNSGGLASTTNLINRLMRLVFESAIPPTVGSARCQPGLIAYWPAQIAAGIDLIMTQILGPRLLWHLVINFALSKLYIISLLYTLNCINEYRRARELSGGVNSSGSRGLHGPSVKRGDIDLVQIRKPGQVLVETQIITHISPSTGDIEDQTHASQDDGKRSEWH